MKQEICPMVWIKTLNSNAAAVEEGVVDYHTGSRSHSSAEAVVAVMQIDYAARTPGPTSADAMQVLAVAEVAVELVDTGYYYYYCDCSCGGLRCNCYLDTAREGVEGEPG